MEYIEEKPTESKKLSRKNKIILAASIITAVTAVIGVTYAILIDKVFLDYDNASLYRFSYETDDENREITIDSISTTKGVPAILRIPNKLNGYPVTRIGDNALSYCKTVEQVILPESIKSIGKEAFNSCSNLKTINFPASLVSVGTDALAGTKWLEEQGEGEVMVGKFLYTYNGTLPADSIIVKDMNSPEATRHTGKVVNLGNYSDISNGVFKNQKNLVYVEIPESFKEIHTELFHGCSNLETVVLPDGLEIIGPQAFKDCVKLENITLPNSVSQIGKEAFYDADLSGALALPEMIDDIGDYAFAKNDITSVTFPAQRTNGGLNTIPAGMFSECELLSEVTIPTSEYNVETSRLSYIGESAFKGTAIVSMTIPYNVDNLQDAVFMDTPNLTKVEVYNNLKGTKKLVRYADKENGGYTWERSQFSRQGLRMIGSEAFFNSVSFKGLVLVDQEGNKTSDNAVSLPVTLESLGVKASNSYLFANTAIETINLVKDFTGVDEEQEYENISYVAPYLCSNAAQLSTVNIKTNDKLDSILAGAFEKCTSLVTIEIPDGIQTIGAGVFSGCTNLTNVDLSKAKVNGIAARLFEDCKTITSFDVNPDAITIQHSAFKNATALTTVHFPEETQFSTIMEYAFSGCTALEDINLPASIATILDEAFAGTTSLKHINLGNIITNLGTGAFKGSGLEEINLPRGIKVLNPSLFEGCASLTSLTLNYDEGVVYLNSSALKECGITETTGTIYVPASLVDTYKANTNWAKYAERIQAIDA